MGIKVTFVKAGEKKVDANPFEPLSDTAKADLQEEVDHYYQEFVGDVARFRGVSKEFVIEHFGAGGRVLSDRALSKGMIDGILSYKEVLAREIELLEDQSQAAIAKDFMVRTKLFLELEKC
jgi:ClpP class serine protease